MPALVARTGYTGEDGFEFYVPQERTGELWDALIDAGRAVRAGADRAGRARHAAAGSTDAALWQRTCRRHQPARSRSRLGGQAGQGAVRRPRGDCRREGERPSAADRRISACSSAQVRRGMGTRFNWMAETIGVVTSGAHSPTLGAEIGLALDRGGRRGSGQAAARLSSAVDPSRRNRSNFHFIAAPRLESQSHDTRREQQP